MLKLTTALSALFISLFFISCQKEISGDLPKNSTEQEPPPPNTPVGDIKGNYKFLYMTVNSTAESEVSAGGEVNKTVTLSQYTTVNNAGTIKFDANTFSSSNLSYDINTMVKAYTYANGKLIDSTNVPLQFSVPANSSTVRYNMVGSDSLYCSAGTMFTNNSTQPIKPIGVKLQSDGSKLYMAMTDNRSTTQNVQGVNIVSNSSMTIMVVLRKL